ncbi:hypothetical protein [Streptomyces bacillaris]|uniref:hypothetical protein n=1 Tax=Streptomyces bacillaris TaxID=68179 RepID=UPI003824BD2F
MAVDEADLALLGRSRESFASYWHGVDAQVRAAARTGRPVRIRPLVAFDFEAFCARRRLDPRGRDTLAAYEAEPVPAEELLLYQGEPADVLLQLMRHERDAWATGLRARRVLSNAVAQFGTAAEDESRADARQLLDTLVGGADDGDVLVLVAKAAGLVLGSYGMAVGRAADGTLVDERDRHRMETLLAAALLASARGTATLTSAPRPGANERVRVWELSPAGLTPSEHGELILAPNTPAPRGPKVDYVPGFDLLGRSG